MTIRDWLDLILEFRDVLMLFLGAVVGFFLARVGAWLDARRRKHMLATMTLTELRWLDFILRQVATGGPVRYNSLEHPSLLATIGSAHVFDPSTIEKLVHFRALLSDTQAANAFFAENHSKLIGERARYVTEIKAKAAFACQAVPDIVEELTDAGGIMPPPMPGESIC